MQYLEFQRLFGKYTVFSLSEIRQEDPRFHRRRLNEWQKKGYLKKLINGCYLFSERVIDEKTLFEIANRIYSPSYVSCEAALSYHGLIPESVYGITSASTRKTSHFKTAIGDFIYRTIRPRLYFGFEYVKSGERYCKIACPEKAFLDHLYLRPDLGDAGSFSEMRVGREIFLKVMDHTKMNAYAAVYGQKALSRRVKSFWEYIRHA